MAKTLICQGPRPEEALWGPYQFPTPYDRSSLANIPIETPKFHEWDGACNNPGILAIDENRALVFYSDFYVPDEHGVKRKSILCQEIIVEE